MKYNVDDIYNKKKKVTIVSSIIFFAMCSNDALIFVSMISRIELGNRNIFYLLNIFS